MLGQAVAHRALSAPVTRDAFVWPTGLGIHDDLPSEGLETANVGFPLPGVWCTATPPAVAQVGP